MKKLLLLLLALTVVACSDSDSANVPDELTGPADLLIDSIKQVGDITFAGEKEAQVPITLVLRNRGGTAADYFKIGVSYTLPGKLPADVAFFTARKNGPYPSVEGLAAGAEMELSGTLRFPSGVAGVAQLVATIDSCAEELLSPVYCFVNESDETNNKSIAIKVEIPADLIAM